VFNAFSRIIKEEGIKSCWNGATPTICRAMSLNVAMLVTYDETKERLTASLGKETNPRLI
jgi:solute carrier family 25 (mitochondrial oxoglutarate transporter), member 11